MSSINIKFTANDVTKMINDRIALINQAILTRLRLVGEKFVKNARENGDYLDQTGNLRSSIGYMIFKDGERIYQNFQSYTKTSSDGGRGASINSKAGAEQARSLAEEIAKRYPKGYVLVGVAGMQYAAAVESKGRDVITSSAMLAESNLRKAIDELRTKLIKN